MIHYFFTNLCSFLELSRKMKKKSYYSSSHTPFLPFSVFPLSTVCGEIPFAGEARDWTARL
jgi:hypothetical protein